MVAGVSGKDWGCAAEMGGIRSQVRECSEGSARRGHRAAVLGKRDGALVSAVVRRVMAAGYSAKPQNRVEILPLGAGIGRACSRARGGESWGALQGVATRLGQGKQLAMRARIFVS